MSKKKGFTLIELMIVLAIIAILAVVLIPKASIFKNQARNSGVSTNVNAVRAYLENKTGTQFISDSTTLKSALDTTFSGDNALKNPLVPGSGSYIVTNSEPLLFLRGTVVIIIDNTNKKYTIFGIDNGLQKINKNVIK